MNNRFVKKIVRIVSFHLLSNSNFKPLIIKGYQFRINLPVINDKENI